MKSILLVDDQPIVLEGLKSVFAGNGWLVADAVSTIDEAIAGAMRHSPSCILTELFVRGHTAFDFFRAIKATRRRTPPFIAFSTFHEMEKYVKEVGFAGFIEKGVPSGQLIPEVNQLLQGVPASPGHTPCEETESPEDRQDSIHGVTFHILTCLAQGKMKKEISDMLSISYSGVDYHINKLKQIFRVQSREELIYTATKRNII